MKGDWKRGIRELALGANKEWKAAAESEIANPVDAAGQFSLANAWWDIAEKMSGAQKQLVRIHAAEWYQRALPNCDPASKARAEIRLEFVRGIDSTESAILALHNRLPKTLALRLSGKIAMEFVLITAGKFQMGSTEKVIGLDQHAVTISRPFYLAKHEVFVEQYKLLLSHEFLSVGPRAPITTVSHEDALKFCDKLSSQSNLVCRLPTEAEWEYACRAGAKTVSLAEYEAMSWGAENSGGALHEVGTMAPNAWGLHDMFGNVSEWCADTYERGYYLKSPPVDPLNKNPSDTYVSRGGSFTASLKLDLASHRQPTPLAGRFNNLGFRVALDARSVLLSARE